MTPAHQKLKIAPEGFSVKRWRTSRLLAGIRIWKRRIQTYPKSVGAMLILGLWMAISIKSEFLFFKELLSAGIIIGMILLQHTVRHPWVVISRQKEDRSNRN